MGKAVWGIYGTVAHGGGRESEELGREEAGAGSLTEVLAGVVKDWDLIPLATEKSDPDLICILTLFAF